MTEEERKEKNRLKVAKWRAQNPEKQKAARAAWQKANPEKFKAARSAYYEANREKCKTASEAWQKANPEKTNAAQAKYQKNRRITDPVYAMSVRLRNRLSSAFKANGCKKQSTTEKMLGCSFAKFKRHIEKQFTDGMNWNNRSEWHLDHIIPLSCATTIQGLEKLSHYSNIRPLWAKDNLVKSDNLVLSDY